MKVLLNLTNDTLEYQDTKVFIQGTDARNKIIVYADEDITFTNLTIAYQLQNGRTTIAMANSGVVESDSDDYIEDYTGYIFNVPLSVTALTGNIMATVVANISGAKHKFNVLNTVIDSVFFEAYETALEEAESEFATDIEAMQSAIAQLQSSKADKTVLNAEIARATAKEGELETAIGNEVTRATGKENEIAGNLATEILRATSVEGGLNTRLTTLEGEIGYVELSGSSDTLTDEQYAEALKKDCIIIRNGISYYKENETPSYIIFARIMYSRTTSNEALSLSRWICQITKSTKVYAFFSSADITTYPSTVIDTKVNAAGHKIALTIDSDFKLQAILKDKNNNTISSSNVIDLPLESVVVSGSYDAVNKKVILTLQDGSTIEFSVADLIDGLQSEITAQNMLSSDLVDDTNQVHKFVNATEKAMIDDIGYIELSGTSGTLTDTQYTEAQKKYCYITSGNQYYYKWRETNSIITFITPTFVYNNNNYYIVNNVYTVNKTNKNWEKTSTDFYFYTKSETDTLLQAKVDKSQIGYLALDGSSGTLTDEQYAECLKPYCFIKLGNILFYKTYDNPGLVFRCIPILASTSDIKYKTFLNDSVQVYSSKNWSRSSFDYDIYIKSGIDTMLSLTTAEKQDIIDDISEVFE